MVTNALVMIGNKRKQMIKLSLGSSTMSWTHKVEWSNANECSNRKNFI